MVIDLENHPVNTAGQESTVVATHDANRTATTTRSGRTVRPVSRLIEEIEATIIEEIMAVGAGIGGGFNHTSELIPMTYHEAMAKDLDGWSKAVLDEFNRMEQHHVWEVVSSDEVPNNAKVLTTTWAMKHKANGQLRARLNARGFEQVPGEHYDENGVSSPTVNEASIFLILILIVMARMHAELNDVKGAFLNGEFSQGEKLYPLYSIGIGKVFP